MITTIILASIGAILSFISVDKYGNWRTFIIVAWYDMWVGFFWDKKKHWLYIFPIPCIGIVIKFRNQI